MYSWIGLLNLCEDHVPHTRLTKQIAHNLVSADLLIGYGKGRCLQKGEIDLFYHAQNQTRHYTSVRKSCGCKIQKDCLTLALVVNTTSMGKLKHVII